jgi:FkbM family methyltransferase
MEVIRVHPRYITLHARHASRLRSPARYLWREVVARRQVLASYRLRESGRTLHLRHRTQDLGSFHEVFVKRNYDPPPPALEILSALPDGFLAADLGANIGLFGVRLLGLRPDARIVAFEPDPANLAVLRATVAANGAADRWQVIDACALTADGNVAFRSGEFLHSRVIDGPPNVRALDVFPLISQAGLIKIDIEGSEGSILADDRFLSLEARLIAMEYHPPHPRSWVEDRFRTAGFTVQPFRERASGLGEFWAWR